MEGPTHLSDCTSLIKAYQKALFSSTDEESVYSALLPQLANIRATATSTSALLTNIGTTNTSNSVVANADKSISITPNDVINPVNWQEILEACIPCGTRINFGGELISLLPVQFLIDITKLLDQLLDQLDSMISLLNSGDVYGDLCQLYKFFTDFVCIPDLQRIVALLAAMLFKMSIQLGLTLDVIRMLVQPIFLPIFVNITGMLHQFVSLIIDPLDCVMAALDLQLEKLDVTKGLSTVQVQAIADSATQTSLTGFSTEVSIQKDIGIDQIQSSLFSGMKELKYFVGKGTRDMKGLLDSYILEIGKFVDGVHGDRSFFETQLEKLKIIRLINFITAVISVLNKGFQCNDPPKGTTEEFASLITEFLSPANNITVTINPVTGNTELVIDNTDIQDALTGPQVITTTGNSTIDNTINRIINRATQPVVFKPQCTFNTTNNSKVGQWMADLDGVNP